MFACLSFVRFRSRLERAVSRFESIARFQRYVNVGGIGCGVVAVILLASGCGRPDVGSPVDQVLVLRGAEQCVMPGEAAPEALVVEFLSPRRGGMFGGKGERQPVAGARVRVEPENGADLSFEPREARTDAGGMARFIITAGNTVGDHYFRVVPTDFPDKAVTVRLVCGMTIEGGGQEGSCGGFLPKPLLVSLVDGDGKPLVGADVFFRVINSPGRGLAGASLAPANVKTDEHGRAESRMRLGRETGTYSVSVAASAPSRGIFFRGVEFKASGIASWTFATTIVGGLAVFIFGMKMMSDGLHLVAGERMKNILQYFAANRFVAVGAGVVATGVIQSSSACTVMVVGFVNAGILSLRQAIGIIFGSNIGTTVTAQMISLKLDGIVFPAIILGMVVLMTSRKFWAKGWGQAILGFGLLFMGMSIMGDNLKIIGDFPTFINFFKLFDCSPVNGHTPLLPVIGAMGIGMVMTVLVQSSSATIGIAIALAVGGLINFHTAVPLIIGDNIGTTVTAALASMGASKPAKQAALAHFLFNFLGAAYMTVLLFVRLPGSPNPIFLDFINRLTAGDVFATEPENIARHIAMAHTVFNVFNLLVFLPTIGWFVKICNAVIRIDENELIRQTLLEPHLLKTPAAAIEQSILAMRHMTRESWDMVRTAFDQGFMLNGCSEELERQLVERENAIDQLQLDLTDYMTHISKETLTEPQTELIPLLMHCANDAERVADHTENIVGLTNRLAKRKKKLSQEAIDELGNLWRELTCQAEHVIDGLDKTDRGDIEIALRSERRINKLSVELEKNHLKRMRKGKADVVNGIIFIEMLSELERIGDHFANIAERAAEIKQHHLRIRRVV